MKSQTGTDYADWAEIGGKVRFSKFIQCLSNISFTDLKLFFYFDFLIVGKPSKAMEKLSGAIKLPSTKTSNCLLELYFF